MQRQPVLGRKLTVKKIYRTSASRCQAAVRLENALGLQSNQWIAKAATIALGNGKHF